MKKIYSKEEVGQAVEKSRCYSEVFKNLGIRLNGGSYPWIKKMIGKFGLDTSHFLSKAELQKIAVARIHKANLETLDYSKPLPNGYRLKSSRLQCYLKHNNVKHECSVCGLSEWMGKEIVLDIDHVDGDCFNNALSNLNYLCPNCHRQKTSLERYR